MSYTKGEWTLNIGDDGAVIYEPDIGTIAEIPIDIMGWEANAHLIAAAPDMYEALKSVRDCFNALIEQGRMALIFRSPEKLVNQALAKAESK